MSLYEYVGQSTENPLESVPKMPKALHQSTPPTDIYMHPCAV